LIKSHFYTTTFIGKQYKLRFFLFNYWNLIEKVFFTNDKKFTFLEKFVFEDKLRIRIKRIPLGYASLQLKLKKSPTCSIRAILNLCRKSSYLVQDKKKKFFQSVNQYLRNVQEILKMEIRRDPGLIGDALVLNQTNYYCKMRLFKSNLDAQKST